MSRQAVRRAALGAATAGGLQALLRAQPAPSWERSNHRGRTVSLLSGPALAVAAGSTADLPRAAALVAALGSGAVGAYDDRAGARHPRAKGFRGHAAALRSGQLTAGAVKVVGIGATGLLAARLSGARGRDALLQGALVAGTANLANLLDLRPGRALKAGAGAALALGQPGPAGAALALLPADLAETTMLGDAGANALGAVLGLALPRRPLALAVVVALTAASEVVSYSRVIDAVPPLRWADRAGRRP